MDLLILKMVFHISWQELIKIMLVLHTMIYPNRTLLSFI